MRQTWPAGLQVGAQWGLRIHRTQDSLSLRICRAAQRGRSARDVVFAVPARTRRKFGNFKSTVPGLSRQVPVQKGQAPCVADPAAMGGSSPLLP